VSIRAATPGDADEIAETVAQGFETYRSFAPEGWQPPDKLELAMSLVMRLADPDWWCVLEPGAGHVAFMPAAKHRWPSDDPGMAHLLQLFVRRAFWGTGLATSLHDLCIAEAAARGYTSMRLFTPELQQRGRRFYEREGWLPYSDPWLDAELGLSIIEYRRELAGSGSGATS
jgi:GNAT superfamily N-acetyltransferase